MGWIELPGNLKVLSNLIIIIAAVAIFLIEFVADKVPYIDSAWDSVHTIIRPLGAVAMGYMAGSDQGLVVQTLYAFLTGTFALNMHAFKAASRLAINTSPEPFSNIAASTTENASVFFVFWLFIKHPILASALIILILVLSFLFLRMLWKFVMKLFKRKPAEPPPAKIPAQP